MNASAEPAERKRRRTKRGFTLAKRGNTTPETACAPASTGRKRYNASHFVVGEFCVELERSAEVLNCRKNSNKLLPPRLLPLGPPSIVRRHSAPRIHGESAVRIFPLALFLYTGAILNLLKSLTSFRWKGRPHSFQTTFLFDNGKVAEWSSFSLLSEKRYYAGVFFLSLCSLAATPSTRPVFSSSNSLFNVYVQKYSVVFFSFFPPSKKFRRTRKWLIFKNGILKFHEHCLGTDVERVREWEREESVCGN